VVAPVSASAVWGGRRGPPLHAIGIGYKNKISIDRVNE